VTKLATIGIGKTAIACKIFDLSLTGAALAVETSVGIPRHFILAIPEDSLQLPCEIVWQREYRIGVKFEQPL
jgi:hypothetical protein